MISNRSVIASLIIASLICPLLMCSHVNEVTVTGHGENKSESTAGYKKRSAADYRATLDSPAFEGEEPSKNLLLKMHRLGRYVLYIN